VIACDLIVGSAPDVLTLARPDTHVLANEDVTPTGEFQTNRNLDLTASRFITAIGKRVAPENIATLRAGALAGRLLGDTIFTNLMMVGFAAQKGLLPVLLGSIEEAIRLNGVAAKANLNALALGRLAAHSAADLFDLADASAHPTPLPRTFAEVVESRTKLLTAYQNEAYASQYGAFLDEVAAALKARGVDDSEPLMVEVAKGLGKLMAYKDEYEVGRLYSDPAFLEGLRDQFSGDPKLKINLGSPLISWKKDAKTGRPKKVAIPGWLALPAFRLLAKLKGLRGTPFDVLGWQADRRLERALIGEYRDLIREVAGKITSANLHTATEIAAAADLIAGYGPVKEQGVEAFRARVAELLRQLDSAESSDRPIRAMQPAAV
jgi:indolepyruvate ferredoxin oxidoreductase